MRFAERSTYDARTRPEPIPIDLRAPLDSSSSVTPQAFEELVGPHLDKLYRLAYRLTGTVADAEDLLQDVLVRAYERRAELTAIDVPATWLARVLHNRFVDDTRRRARGKLVVVGSTEDAVTMRGSQPDVVASAPDPLDIRRLASALDRLGVEHRTVLLMHDAEGYKLQEIETITGIPLGTLKSRLHRGRARLRALLEADGTFSAPPAC
jgi:RNA polymerase sigma-70 factor, ECF subfamily